MYNLIIVGAGGYGRVVLSQCKNDVEHGQHWQLKGFLDDRQHILDGYDSRLPIIGSPFSYAPQQNDIFICALGESKAKRKYTAPLLDKGAYFTSLWTDASIGENVRWGNGNIFEPKVSIAPDVTFKNFVTVGALTIIGHDVVVDSYSHIGCFVFIGGWVKIEAGVTIHPHATILPNVTIGEGAIIGAGSMVAGNVPAHTTVMGNPAKKFIFK